MVVACSICDEPYGEDRRPLLLACCKGGPLCECCLQAHLRVSNRCPLLCETRPSVRHFVKQCLEATPPIEEFLKTLEKRETKDEQTGPSTVKLGEAGLFNVYVKSREIKGDAQVALKLQMEYEEEQRQKLKKDEDKDMALALKLQEQEQLEKENLKKRLTKRPSDVNSVVVSKNIERESKVCTLDTFFKPKQRKPSLSSQRSPLRATGSTSSTSSSSFSSNAPSTAPKKQRVEVEIICLDT